MGYVALYLWSWSPPWTKAKFTGVQVTRRGHHQPGYQCADVHDRLRPKWGSVGLWAPRVHDTSTGWDGTQGPAPQSSQDIQRHSYVEPLPLSSAYAPQGSSLPRSPSHHLRQALHQQDLWA